MGSIYTVNIDKAPIIREWYVYHGEIKCPNCGRWLKESEDTIIDSEETEAHRELVYSKSSASNNVRRCNFCNCAYLTTQDVRMGASGFGRIP